MFWLLPIDVCDAYQTVHHFRYLWLFDWPDGGKVVILRCCGYCRLMPVMVLNLFIVFVIFGFTIGLLVVKVVDRSTSSVARGKKAFKPCSVSIDTVGRRRTSTQGDLASSSSSYKP
ncbi:hypothetical protein QVD17_35371 [Tagetes erecta]|uniref:Uncharacterized protein n=1 Tax=Tagetes erecta TaxID=13708 RepID=A0AAD8NF49_TARER|nr:hypothetical protein QVD17_35371 [Tagetes erecta]